MKSIKFLILGLIFFLFNTASFGQSVTYSAAESLFSSDQTSKLEKAEKLINRAENSLNSASEIEDKYEKLKSKKKKKYDKKVWEAKRIRIQAEQNFQKAYKDAVGVYSEIINDASYYIDSDQEEANALNDDASDLIGQSDKKMKSYNNKVLDTKGLKKMSSSSLTSAINSARNYKESAYNKQTAALDIVLSQNRKKEERERDDEAWQNAQDMHTIASYNDYIDNFPQGRYVQRARSAIQELEAELEKNNTPIESDYRFHVQIAASKRPLPKYELASKYRNTNEIDKVFINNLYKYRVGEFNNYAEAARLRDSLGSSAPDSFVVVYDKNGNQIEVTDSMKGGF